MKAAVYYQNTGNHDLEFKLVELSTKREVLVDNLRDLELALKDGRRQVDDDIVLEGISNINAIRAATFDLIDQISLWQKIYVKSRRPQIMSVDYLIKMITQLNFMGMSRIRKFLNFGVSRGNIFLLPISTGRITEPAGVSRKVMQQLQIFVNPNVDKVIECYSFFQKCVPEFYFNKLFPLNEWAKRLWNMELHVLTDESIGASRPHTTNPSRPPPASPLYRSMVSFPSEMSLLTASYAAPVKATTPPQKHLHHSKTTTRAAGAQPQDTACTACTASPIKQTPHLSLTTRELRAMYFQAEDLELPSSSTTFPQIGQK